MKQGFLNILVFGLLLLWGFSGWSEGMLESSIHEDVDAWLMNGNHYVKEGGTCQYFPRRFRMSFAKSGLNKTEGSPSQVDAHHDHHHLLLHHHEGCEIITETGAVHVDYDRRRIRIDIHTDPFSNKFSKSIFMDFDANVKHRVDHKRRKCESNQMVRSHSMDNHFPEGTRYLMSGMIGGQMVEMYEWKAEKCSGVFSVTRSMCHPVSSSAIVKLENTDKTSSTLIFDKMFWNFVPDVPPLLFDVPDICEHNPQSTTRHTSNEMMSIPFLWM